MEDNDNKSVPACLVVRAEDAGLRLDRFLADNLEGLSRVRVQDLIRSRQVVSGDTAVVDPAKRISEAEEYAVTIPKPVPAEPAGEDIALDVLFEDSELIVVNKPAGLVVHPASGHERGTLVNALIAHCGDSLSGIGGVRRPGIVHRLDKDTSGVLVVAKTDHAHHGLAEQFAAHGRDGRMKRRYVAVCWRVPLPKKGTVDAPLARASFNRRKIAVVRAESAGARHAVTHYDVVRTFSGSSGQEVASLLRLELETGRTHQIRVHMAHVHHPLLGDPVYGAGFQASAVGLGEVSQRLLGHLKRQALHAAELSFLHPVSGERLSFRARVPFDLGRLLVALEHGW